MRLLLLYCFSLMLYGEGNTTNETNTSQKMYIDSFTEGLDSVHEYVTHKVKVVSSNADKQVTDWAHAIKDDDNKTTTEAETKKDEELGVSTSMSNYFGDFFKDETFLNANNESYLRVRLGPEFNQNDGNRWEASFSFNLNLPHTQDSLKLFIGEDVDADLNDKVPNPEANDPSLGMKYFIPEFVNGLETDFTAGITGINLFVRTQLQYPFDFHDWRLRPVWRVQYSVEDEFKEETRMYFDRRISSSEMVRLFLKRETETQKFGQRYFAQISYFNTLKYKVGFNNYIAVSGDSEYFRNHPDYIPDGYEHSGIDNYKVGAVWKEQFFRKWLFYEIEPIVEWDRRFYYEENYIVKATLEFWFGEI